MEAESHFEEAENSNAVEKCQPEDKAKSCSDDQKARAKDDEDTNLECPVCLQTCIYPVQLPCRHIFCFLCLKGAASRSKYCALCRQRIPPDFFRMPNLLRRDELEQTVTFDDGYGWFYEGENGWWQYDDRTSQELERNHKAGHPTCELLIAGYLYVIDLTNMVQSRRNDRTRKRRVKRDLVNLPGRKGVAGLKITSGSAVLDSDRPGADGHETTSSSGSSSRSSQSTHQTIPIRQADRSGDHQSLSPPTPHNTPQTPMTPSESPPHSATTTERDLSVHLERLRLVDSGPVSVSPVGSSAGPSSRGYDTPEQLSTSLEDATRLENVRASLQQLQSNQGGGLARPGIILPSDLDVDAEDFAPDCDFSVVQV